MIRILALTCLATVFPLNGFAAATPLRPPNIVLIIADDQSWPDFHFMGHPAIRTPNLDRLAARSALFRRGYVPTSLCRPSLATIISGLYPHQHGITGNDPPKGADRSAMLEHIRAAPTLPRLLARAGYRSFQAGKWWEGSFSQGGFTAGMTHGDPRRGGRHGDEGLRIGREGLKPIFDFVDASGDNPYFLWYAPMMPHEPHNPPRRLVEKYTAPGRPERVARYFAMCEWFDETCGQLLDFLDSKGQTEKTLVVFLADNGWIPPDPAMAKRGGQFARFAPRSKNSPYEGGTRSPVMICWPGRIAPAEYSTLVSSIDIAPTVLAAAGLSKTPEMSGINLLDVIAHGGQTARHVLFGESYTHNVPDLANPTQGLTYRWCIDDNWKLIVPADRRQEPELYDLRADPHENRNDARQNPEKVQALSALLDAWWPGTHSKRE
jgi:uncharacterized sulfatase